MLTSKVSRAAVSATLLLCGVGCTAARDDLLEAGMGAGYPPLADSEQPTALARYRAQGIFYEEWEDSGFIPQEFLMRAGFEIQKTDAYCVRVEPACHRRLDRALAAVLPGVRATYIDAVVLFEGEATGTMRDPIWNQCWRGHILVERILAARPVELIE